MRQNRKLTSADIALTLALLTIGLPLFTGCGDGKLPLYPVTGTIMVDGKPADGAMVIFCPLESSSPELRKERPFGTTGPDGKFKLTTFLQDDGIPLGEYKVLVQWIPAGAAYDERAGGGADRLRGRYMNLEKTPLQTTITKEALELPPFDLKTR
jgi:hypothetical protein